MAYRLFHPLCEEYRFVVTSTTEQKCPPLSSDPTRAPCRSILIAVSIQQNGCASYESLPAISNMRLLLQCVVVLLSMPV